MTVLASVGSKINVKNRQDRLESNIIERGRLYEVLYDLEKDVSRTEALALVLEIRRQSYKSGDFLMFEYAEVTSGSPQNLKFQFKGLKSTGSPFVFTLALAIAIVVAASTIAAVALISYLTIRGIWVIQAVTADFIPQTVYKCKVCGETFKTYEGLVQHYAEEHPDMIPPSPEESEGSETPLKTWIFIAAGIIAAIVIIYMMVVRK